MYKLLIATNNRGKLIEIQALLADLDLELVYPGRIGLELEVEEDGETYGENAAAKGAAFARASGMPALADDSGLEVQALNWEPGIRSHRFAPQPDATDADRRRYLLERLKDIPRPWTARFHCTVALARPDPQGDEVQIALAEGYCHGEIIPEERGENGFGYDPIFYLPDFRRTMAELSLEEKNRVSHRANAVRAAKDLIQGFVR